MAQTKTAAPLVNPYTYCRNCGQSMNPIDPDRSPAEIDGCCSLDCMDTVLAADFVRLNSNPEHTERRTVIVTNKGGAGLMSLGRFCARLVMPGDRYGAIGHNVGQRDLQPNELCKVNEGQPLIEWYADANRFTPIGQHTGATYNLTTMAKHYADTGRGLSLAGSIPEWTVCASAFGEAYRILVVEQGLDPDFVLGNNNKWTRLERIDHGSALPWSREGVEYNRTNSAGQLYNRPLFQVVNDLDELIADYGSLFITDGTFVALEDLTRADKLKVCRLVKWGLVWRDHLTGRIDLTTLGRLWSGFAAPWDFKKAEGHHAASLGGPGRRLCFNRQDAANKWADDEITALRQLVIDAIDAQLPYSEGTGIDHIHDSQTFAGRKRSLDQAKAFRAYLDDCADAESVRSLPVTR